MQYMWSLVYLCSPHHLVVAYVAAYAATGMRGYLEAHGIQLDEAQIVTPGALETVERYHAPMILAYQKI